MASFSLMLIIISGVFFTGLFAGAETGIYQVSRLRLRLGIEKKRFASVVLGKALHDTSGLLTSTLVGTNISIYIVTSAVTYIILKKTQSGHSAEFFATIITAPPLFIFSELIPKNLFFYYSDTLMLKIAPLLFGFYKLLSWCGIIAVFKYISLILAKLTHTPIPSNGIINAVQRHETTAFFKDIHEESFLSKVQTDIVNRLLIVSNTTLNRVMIPFRKTQLISVNSNRQAVLGTIRKHEFTRFPVYENTQDNIIGFIEIYDVLCSKKKIVDLYDFVKPVKKIPQNTLVTNALETMQMEKEKIALVVRVTRKNDDIPVGIITMKDLAEELFGELGSW
jgi:CBS domain containing-hemolysin-like protein